MIRNITTVIALLTALASCTGQSPDNTFAVHAEIMGASALYDAPERENEKPVTASNISIGTQSVYAYYHNAEFILSYCGKVFIETGGKGKELTADVYQIEPGVWIAELAGGQYVKVFTKSGNANVDLDGEFRVYERD